MFWRFLGGAAFVAIVIFALHWHNRGPATARPAPAIPAQRPPDVEGVQKAPEGAAGAIMSPSDDVMAQATQGDTHAQSRACAIHMTAGDATREYAEAVRWCALAAAAGDAEAQSSYARQHQFGLGVAQNDQLAIEWYEKAVTQQNAHAMYMLGQLLYKIGAPADEARGVALLQRAATLGNLNARWALQNLGVAPEKRPGQPLLTPPSP